MPRRTKEDIALDQHIGRRINVRRTLQGMSQTELAEKCGITFQQLQKYESGVNRVAGSRLWQLANALNVDDMGYFFPSRDGSVCEKEAKATRRNLEAMRYLDSYPPDLRDRMQALLQGVAEMGKEERV